MDDSCPSLSIVNTHTALKTPAVSTFVMTAGRWCCPSKEDVHTDISMPLIVEKGPTSRVLKHRGRKGGGWGEEEGRGGGTSG